MTTNKLLHYLRRMGLTHYPIALPAYTRAHKQPSGLGMVKHSRGRYYSFYQYYGLLSIVFHNIIVLFYFHTPPVLSKKKEDIWAPKCMELAIAFYLGCDVVYHPIKPNIWRDGLFFIKDSDN